MQSSIDEHFEWFQTLHKLTADAIDELETVGFTVVRSGLAPDDLQRLANAYDEAIASASPEDVRIGSTTTRVNDFVNRGPEFDPLYIFPPLLEACYRTISQPFKLSSMLARIVRPGVPSQEMHVDFERYDEGWPMVGFIFMVDEFRPDNGATRFLPGSHGWNSIPDEKTNDLDGLVSACGPSGSVIIYNGSVWHGHGPNTTSEPRRAIIGAFIRRDDEAPADLPARMRPDTLARISPLAKYLLAV